MLRLLSSAAALAIILATGLVHGFWTDRWTISQDLEHAVALIESIPEQVGDWQGEPLKLDAEMLKVAEVEGYLARRFRNSRDGREVTVLLVCGRSGPIARHTPDVCYQGLGYAASGEVVTDQVGYGAGLKAPFRSVLMQRNAAAGSDALDILWTWNAFGAWEAPANERTRFVTSRFLYKLYVIHPRNPGEENGEDTTNRDFLQELLPVIDQALFSQESSSTKNREKTLSNDARNSDPATP